MADATFGVIKQDYFEWLCEKVEIGVVDGLNQYTNLARILYSVPYFWSCNMDENRMKDGKALRDNYSLFLKDRKNVYSLIIEHHTKDWKAAIDGPCTFLEFLIALCERIDRDIATDFLEESGGRSSEWFWLLMENLGFLGYSDAVWDSKMVQKITKKLDFVMTRQYDDDGTGSLFPLRNGKNEEKYEKLVNSIGQNAAPIGQTCVLIGQNLSKIGQNVNSIGQNRKKNDNFAQLEGAKIGQNWAICPTFSMKNQDVWHQANFYFRVHPELLK